MVHFSNVVLKNEQSTLPKVADGLLFIIRLLIESQILLAKQ